MKFALHLAAFGLVAIVVIAECQASRQMAGPYTLVLREGCDVTGIVSSKLVLHSDGTYEQHHRFTNGRAVDYDGEPWTYSKGMVRFKNLRINGKGEVPVGATATEVKVKADPVRPPSIALPDSQHCYYTGPK